MSNCGEVKGRGKKEGKGGRKKREKEKREKEENFLLKFKLNFRSNLANFGLYTSKLKKSTKSKGRKGKEHKKREKKNCQG